jgi:hypothetical protein
MTNSENFDQDVPVCLDYSGATSPPLDAKLLAKLRLNFVATSLEKGPLVLYPFCSAADGADFERVLQGG